MATNSLAHQAALWFTLLLGGFVYCYGLDGQNIPTNGDELVYAHITRLTASSGEWLPLQSTLEAMRNTKPPLLFWQGIASTEWGKHWSLLRLRYPSVLYTLLTAIMVLELTRKLSGQFRTGLIASSAFLAFFSTYRYGRPFLTNPPEVFWLFLPFFMLLYWRPFAFASRLWVPLILGSAVGIGLLYKSFALLLPVIIGLGWWYLHERHYQTRAFLRQDLFKLLLISTVALAYFASWLVLDPDPLSIWQEFIVGENVSKLHSQHSNYLGKLIWGNSSLWSQLLGYPLNAGLLAFPMATLLIMVIRQRIRLSQPEKLLLAWAIVLLVIFSLPSQRSARYLLEAMPALAIVYALQWENISRKAFVISQLTCAASVGLLLYLFGWQLKSALPPSTHYGLAYWLGAALILLVIGTALFKPTLTRLLTHPTIFLVYLLFAVSVKPFDEDLGSYNKRTQHSVRNQEVGVPCHFRGNDERFRFLLPGSQISGYYEDLALSKAELAQRYPVFAIRGKENDCADCHIIGQRWDIRSRHTQQEIREMLQGRGYDRLFIKERLVKGNPRPGLPALSAAETCR